MCSGARALKPLGLSRPLCLSAFALLGSFQQRLLDVNVFVVDALVHVAACVVLDVRVVVVVVVITEVAKVVAVGLVIRPVSRSLLVSSDLAKKGSVAV